MRTLHPSRPLTARLRTFARIGVGVGSLLLANACTKALNTGQASSYLIVSSLEGASGATPTSFSGVLDSDVVTMVSQKVNGQTVSVPTFFDDPGQVAFTLAMKDPGSPTAPSTPSTTNFITVTNYHVQYVRADGRNTPGVDVPYPFDGAVTVTVTGTGGTAGFVLVREQAKEEAPLAAMENGAAAISTIAQVTFYGTDQAGRQVSVTGNIGVNFANWGDPASSGS